MRRAWMKPHCLRLVFFSKRRAARPSAGRVTLLFTEQREDGVDSSEKEGERDEREAEDQSAADPPLGDISGAQLDGSERIRKRRKIRMSPSLLRGGAIAGCWPSRYCALHQVPLHIPLSAPGTSYFGLLP